MGKSIAPSKKGAAQGLSLAGIYLTLLTCFLLLDVGFAAAAVKRILALGDSLTEGYGLAPERSYPAQLEKKLNAKGFKNVRVINGGVSGDTTAAAEGRLKWHLKSKDKPDLVILCFGANDGLRGLTVDKARENLGKVISLAQSQKIKVLLVGMRVPINYGKTYSESFMRIYPALAKQFKVPLVPFLLDKVALDPKFNLPDGIHPNEKGYDLVAENVLPYVVDLLK